MERSIHYQEKIKSKRQNLLENQNCTSWYDLPELSLRKNFAVDTSTHCTCMILNLNLPHLSDVGIYDMGAKTKNEQKIKKNKRNSHLSNAHIPIALPSKWPSIHQDHLEYMTWSQQQPNTNIHILCKI